MGDGIDNDLVGVSSESPGVGEKVWLAYNDAPNDDVGSSAFEVDPNWSTLDQFRGNLLLEYCEYCIAISNLNNSPHDRAKPGERAEASFRKMTELVVGIFLSHDDEEQVFNAIGEVFAGEPGRFATSIYQSMRDLRVTARGNKAPDPSLKIGKYDELMHSVLIALAKKARSGGAQVGAEVDPVAAETVNTVVDNVSEDLGAAVPGVGE